MEHHLCFMSQWLTKQAKLNKSAASEINPDVQE